MKILCWLIVLSTIALIKNTEAQNLAGDWFLSNPIGMALDPLAWSQVSKKEWTLHRRRSGKQEFLTLFQKGKKIKQWIRTLDNLGNVLRSLELQDGKNVREVTYQAPEARAITEREYRDGQFLMEYRYIWQGNRMVTRKLFNEKGEVLFTDKLYHLPDGRLRRVERDSPSGPVAEVAWVYGQDGRITEEWIGQGRQTSFFTYQSDAVLEDLYENGELIESRFKKLSNEGKGIEISNNVQKKVKTTTLRDDQGRIIEQQSENDDQETVIQNWVYDDQGRVIRQTKKSYGERFQIDYTYQKDELSQVEIRRNGRLVNRELWLNGKKDRVQIFVQGELVLEELWQNDEKVKEVYYKDGLILRERQLRPVSSENP